MYKLSTVWEVCFQNSLSKPRLPLQNAFMFLLSNGFRLNILIWEIAENWKDC